MDADTVLEAHKALGRLPKCVEAVRAIVGVAVCHRPSHSPIAVDPGHPAADHRIEALFVCLPACPWSSAWLPDTFAGVVVTVFRRSLWFIEVAICYG